MLICYSLLRELTLFTCALAQPQSGFLGMSLLIWSFVYLIFNLGGEVLK